MGFPDIINFILIILLMIGAFVLLKTVLIGVFSSSSRNRLTTVTLIIIAFLLILAEIVGFKLLFMFFTKQI